MKPGADHRLVEVWKLKCKMVFMSSVSRDDKDGTKTTLRMEREDESENEDERVLPK
jgi:hypothetical protein